MKTKHSLLILTALTCAAQAQLKTGANPNTVTSTAAFEVEATSGNKTVIDKTSGNLGIGTTTPATALTVNGGIATNYTSVTATTYALTATDSTVAWNGTAEGTITLPAAVSGPGNIKGRTYTLKNTSSAYSVTVTAAGSETIGSGSSLTLSPQASMILISTGDTTGSTWQVVSQTGTFGIGGGGFSTGYDLTGLASISHSIPTGSGGGNWTTGSDGSESTDAASDIPSATMATLMNSLPNGGVIKIQLPSVAMAANGSSFDYGLPDASGYVGKTFYMFMDISQTAGPTFSTYGFNYGNVFGSSSDILTSGPLAGDYYARVAALSASSGTNYYMSIFYPASAAAPPAHRPMQTPILKFTALAANVWFMSADGVYINPN